MITLLILAATGLLAAPVGAAVADKPTRMRLLKIAASKRGPRYQVPQIMMPVGVQAKDRTQDVEARTKWSDAMKWCSLRDIPALEASIAQKTEAVREAKEWAEEAQAAYDETRYYVSWLAEQRNDARVQYERARNKKSNQLTDDERAYQRLVEKYGRYCIRNEMVLFDTTALAA